MRIGKGAHSHSGAMMDDSGARQIPFMNPRPLPPQVLRHTQGVPQLIAILGDEVE